MDTVSFETPAEKRFHRESWDVSPGGRCLKCSRWGQTVTMYTFALCGDAFMGTVFFQTITEAETFSGGIVGRTVWVPFSVNVNVWGQTVTIYRFSHSGNVHLIMVCFETLTEEKKRFLPEPWAVLFGHRFF